MTGQIIRIWDRGSLVYDGDYEGLATWIEDVNAGVATDRDKAYAEGTDEGSNK